MPAAKIIRSTQNLLRFHNQLLIHGINTSKKALADMRSGEVLKVVSTDPGSMRDFQAFARQTGNELVEQESMADEFVHFLRRR